jgi:hypothetical protein
LEGKAAALQKGEEGGVVLVSLITECLRQGVLGKVDPPGLSLHPARRKLDAATSKLFHDPASFKIGENCFRLKK